MGPSISTSLACGFIPGFAEAMEQAAFSKGSMQWVEFAREAQYSRNTVYLGVAVAIFGAVRMSSATQAASLKAVAVQSGTTLCETGLVISVIGLWQLYKSISAPRQF